VQVARQLRQAIISGAHPAGQMMPSTNALAEPAKGISRDVVQRAFDLLQAEGLIRPVPGHGTFVCPLRDYQVTVTVRWLTGEDTASRILADVRACCARAGEDEPAVSGMVLTVEPDDWAWTFSMTVRAARGSQAAVIGESAAIAAAAGELGDFGSCAGNWAPAG